MKPQYSTKLFTDIWEEADEFVNFYKTSGIPTTITEESAETLYYLLYARYGNSPIANNDENQFKYKAMAVIFQFGPTWEKKLAIQNKLRNMDEEELLKGAKQIYNHSYNPSTEPSTSTLEELLTVNDQNTTNFKRSKLDAYGLLTELLEEDVTEIILGKFKNLFKQFVRPEHPLIYVTEVEEGEE